MTFRFLSVMLFAWCIHYQSVAQSTSAELVRDMNKYITLYSADEASPLILLDGLAMIEQKLNQQSSQRITLRDISSIKTGGREQSFSVTVECASGAQCISVVKSDMSSSFISSTSFFFSDADANAAFAKKMQSLIEFYAGKPASSGNVTATQLPEKKIHTVAEPAPSSKESLQVNSQDDDEDNKTEVTQKKAKKPVQPLTETRALDDEPQPRSGKRSKPSANKGESDNLDADLPEPESTRKESISLQEYPQLCRQLFAIFEAGKTGQFKAIEGKETNKDEGINQSKVSLKGAKRSYLSWFRNKRAFLAEFKSSADMDLMLELFLDIQTQVEDCLEGAWEDTDHLAETAAQTQELKDVEYKLMSDPSMPSLRLILFTDELKKHTLFVRIQ